MSAVFEQRNHHTHPFNADGSHANQMIIKDTKPETVAKSAEPSTKSNAGSKQHSGASTSRSKYPLHEQERKNRLKRSEQEKQRSIEKSKTFVRPVGISKSERDKDLVDASGYDGDDDDLPPEIDDE